MRWTDCRIIAFDTETTGLNPFDGDRMMEFGAVELVLGPDLSVQRVKSTQFLINPTIAIPTAATRVTGITNEHVAKERVFAERARQIHDLLLDSILIAHNLPFDLNFLQMEFGLAGMHRPSLVAEVDTLPLVQRLLPKLKNHKLETVAHHFDVPLDNAHRAHHDAEACGRMLVELAKAHGAPAELDEFVRWADAVSQPPPTGHIEIGDQGVPVFSGGPHKGELVERHPDYLQWMTMALERVDGRWQPRFPESVTEWSRRWLRARAAGGTAASPRSQGRSDWCLDPAPWR